MQVIIAATYIQLGSTLYPLNSLEFSGNETTGVVNICKLGNHNPIISKLYSEFTNSSDVPYATLGALISDLLLSMNTAGS